MDTAYAQSPDQPTPARDFMIALYWESMYNDGNMTDQYPCKYGNPVVKSGKTKLTNFLKTHFYWFQK